MEVSSMVCGPLNKRTILRLGLSFACVAISISPVVAQYGATNGEWQAYGGDKGFTRYSPLTQITAENIGKLKLAWRWDSPDNAIAKATEDVHPGPNESTPLMVRGRIYESTSLSQVAAIDAQTGKTLWLYN